MQVFDKNKERQKAAFHNGIRGFFLAALSCIVLFFIGYEIYQSIYHDGFMRGYECGMSDQKYFEESGGDLNGVGACQ